MNTIIIVLIAITITSGFISCNTNQKGNKSNNQKLTKNPYNQYRTQAINTTLDQLELKSESADDVFGIIMDWNMGAVIATVVAYKTGDASLYLNSGQIYKGGNSHKTIVKASNEFISIGKQYLSKAKKTDKKEPTNENKVNFYFLTESGRYYIEEDNAKIDDNSSELIDLFYAGNQIITEYRTLTEKK